MDYKNFLLRVFFSIIFLVIYSIISWINFSLVFYLILFIYLLILYEVYLNFKKFKILPFAYILISFFFFFNIDFNKNLFLKFNLFILIVITFDIFSYIIGKSFGKNKLIRISPNKTIEGLIGGIFISVIISLLFSYLMKIEINFYLVIFILFVISFALIGDIIESYFKRKNHLKNSSELIPGHGGVFDRFDSFLFSIIFYSIFINLNL